MLFLVRLDEGEEALLVLELVDLVDREQHGRARSVERIENGDVLFVDPEHGSNLRRLGHEHDRITIEQTLLGAVDQDMPERSFRTLETWRIDEGDLSWRIVGRIHPEDARTRRARARCRDHELLT